MIDYTKNCNWTLHDWHNKKGSHDCYNTLLNQCNQFIDITNKKHKITTVTSFSDMGHYDKLTLLFSSGEILDKVLDYFP